MSSKSIMNTYVVCVDEEGFVYELVGPFTSEAAETFLDEQNENYQGDCQEPFKMITPTDPANFQTEEWD